MKYLIGLSFLIVTACLGGNDDREECHETTVTGEYDFSDLVLSGSFYSSNQANELIVYSDSIIFNTQNYFDDSIQIVLNIERIDTNTIDYEINQEYAGIDECLYSYNHLIEKYKTKSYQVTHRRYLLKGEEILFGDSLSIDEKNKYVFWEENMRNFNISKMHIKKTENVGEIIGFESVLGKFYKEGYTADDMPGRFP